MIHERSLNVLGGALEAGSSTSSILHALLSPPSLSLSVLHQDVSLLFCFLCLLFQSFIPLALFGQQPPPPPQHPPWVCSNWRGLGGDREDGPPETALKNDSVILTYR